MKAKLFSLFAAVMIATTASAQFSGSGSGKEDDPYLIFNPIQLDQVRNFLGKDNVYFKMMADIDLEEFIQDNNPKQGWLPIGTESAPFQGYFDGNGKTISNLMINRPSTDYIGLFGYIYHATIVNLNINVNVVGHDYCGGLIGYSNSKYANDKTTISNVKVSGLLSGNFYLGGILGYITESSTSIIQSCQTDIAITGKMGIGGIAGFVLGADILKSSAHVFLNTTGNYCGGIAGQYKSYYQRNLSECYCSGEIISAGSYIGGIVGAVFEESNDKQISIDHNYFIGRISGASYVGGICGRGYCVRGNVYVRGNYSNAIISGIDYVGGIIGESDKIHVKCNVAINKTISATTENFCCRIGIYTDGSYIGNIGTSSANKALVTTKIISAGVQKEVEDVLKHGQSVGNSVLKYKATYQGIGWNFTNTWDMQENESYPYFQWQTAPPILNPAQSGQTKVSGRGTDGATIIVTIDDKEYRTICSGNNWSVTTDALVAGSTISVTAQTADKSPSYWVSATVNYVGEGTENAPYQIYTAQELTNINGEGYFQIMNDIDLSSINPWIPIGQIETATAHLDGGNHVLKGLNINSTSDCSGLFAQCNGNTLKNIQLEVSSFSGGNMSGALVGNIVDGKIINCTIKGNINGGNNTGGLVGYAQTTNISQCSVTGNVTGTTLVGGLIGYISGSVTKSEYEGIVSSTTASAIVGGLVGKCEASVSECFSIGNALCSKTNSIVGGLIGQNEVKGSVSNSYSTMDIIAVQNAGGLVGYNYGSVENCYASGSITSTKIAGGVIGYNDGTQATTHNCCAMNKEINATSSTGIAIRVIGGLKNSAPTPEMDNFALKTMAVSVNGVAQKIYDDNLNGVSKTEDLLEKNMTYMTIGWDMATIWGIKEGQSYPYLRCFVAPESALHLTDENTILTGGTYKDGVDYTRMVDIQDQYAAFCLPFVVETADNTSLEEMYIPLGVALEYQDAQAENILKVLFVPTKSVEAGIPFIAKLAMGHTENIVVKAHENTIPESIIAQSTEIIPYQYDATANGSHAAVPVVGSAAFEGTFGGVNENNVFVLQGDGNFMLYPSVEIQPFNSYLRLTNMGNVRKVSAFEEEQDLPTSIEEYMQRINGNVCVKYIHQGQFLIFKDGKTYNALGGRVK